VARPSVTHRLSPRLTLRSIVKQCVSKGEAATPLRHTPTSSPGRCHSAFTRYGSVTR